MVNPSLRNTSADQIRSFLALDLPDHALDLLDNVSKELRKSRADVKWVNPKSIHLTLKFLGNINRAMIAEIEAGLEPIFSVISPIKVRVSGIGVFPNARKPRIIWAGIEDPDEIITKTVPRIEEAFFKLGFAREARPFAPHLTLGRSRSEEGRERLIKVISGMNCQSPLFTLKRAVLFQSILKPSGADYSALSVFNLGQPL